MGLSEALQDSDKKANVIKDCCSMIDEEVAGKSGISGLAVKAGYAAVKGIKPGFISHVLESLLPEFATKLDCIHAPLERRQVEPLVRGHEIDDAIAAGRKHQPEIEQHVAARACLHRQGTRLIDRHLKHATLLHLCRGAGWPRLLSKFPSVTSPCRLAGL